MGPPADDDASSHDSYCPNCGSGVQAGDSYCGKCGHELAANDGEPSGAELRQFRRRVGDHVAEGWEIEFDGGNEVALVDRGYGSVGVHILLLIFTSGIGNLLYGWYHYEHTATRTVIRADGPDSTPRRSGGQARAVQREGAHRVQQGNVENESGSLRGYVWGLLAIVLGVGALSSLGLTSLRITVALACLVLATLLLPPTRTRLENRHPPTTFGPTTSVEERYVSGTDRLCSVCFDRIEEGVRREYEQSSVVAGIPLYTIERGENWYCESCRRESSTVTRSIERVPATGAERDEETVESRETEPGEPSETVLNEDES